MIRIYYNPDKKVFVAKKEDGTIIKTGRDFSMVDTVAQKKGKVEYDIDSFPKELRLKLMGKNGHGSHESFKSLFMKLVFSYRNRCPPDSETRKVVRNMLKHKLELVDVVHHREDIYIITVSKTYSFVIFRMRERNGWSTKTVHVSRLPKKVRDRIEKMKAIRGC